MDAQTKQGFFTKGSVTSGFYSLCLLLMLSCYSLFAQAKTEYISIATGGVNGVYYPTGGAICYLVNQLQGIDKINCEIKSTPGSIYNLNALHNFDVDLAVVQSDWQHHAYHGTSERYKKHRHPHLRSLFSVHAEPFTVLAREDANIQSFEDIKGKRVNIGAPNSGQRATMEMLLDLYGWQYDDFASVEELNPSEQAQALCDKKVDVIIYVVGHPNSSIKEATSACQTRLVNVKGDKLDQLVAEHRYYHTTSIPGGMYRANSEQVDTFGVGATLLTRSELPEHVAYEVVKSVFENYSTFISLHPAFKQLTMQSMVEQYISIPLHRGAIKYYKEIGLLK